MVFDNRVGTVQAEGPNIGSELEYIENQSAGRIKIRLLNGKQTPPFWCFCGLMSAVEMPMPKIMMDLMVNDLRAASFDAIQAIYNTNAAFTVRSCTNSSVMKRTGRKWRQYAHKRHFTTQKTINTPFVFGRHQVRWNNEYSAFITMDDNSLISIGGYPVNKTWKPTYPTKCRAATAMTSFPFTYESKSGSMVFPVISQIPTAGPIWTWYPAVPRLTTWYSPWRQGQKDQNARWKEIVESSIWWMLPVKSYEFHWDRDAWERMINQCTNAQCMS